MSCDEATILGTCHEWWEWSIIGNRKMNKYAMKPVHLALASHSSPYFQTDIFLTIQYVGSSPTLQSSQLQEDDPMHCVKCGHDSMLEIGRWANKGNLLGPLSFRFTRFNMVSCSASNTLGNLSCGNLKWWMALLFWLHCMKHKHDTESEVGRWGLT